MPFRVVILINTFRNNSGQCPVYLKELTQKRHSILKGSDMDIGNELIVQKEGSIYTIVINRPEKRNLLTPECLLKMVEVIEELREEGNVLVIIIRGAGDQAFCAGYDISALPTKPTSQMEADLKETPPLERALQAIRKFPYPVIAMLNGYAYGGGCELAIGCDIRIAAKADKDGYAPCQNRACLPLCRVSTIPHGFGIQSNPGDISYGPKI